MSDSEGDSDASSEAPPPPPTAEEMAARMGGQVINIDEMMAKSKLQGGGDDDDDDDDDAPKKKVEKPRSKQVKVSKKAAQAWLSSGEVDPPKAPDPLKEEEEDVEEAKKAALEAASERACAAREAAERVVRLVGEGDPAALSHLGSMAMQAGQAREAVQLWRRAATLGSASAANNLACALAEGVAGEPDFAEVERFLRLAAADGIADAQVTLAELYLGEDRAAEAIPLFQRALDDSKHPDAAFRLGYLYFQGAAGVALDWHKAAILFGIAADKGNPDAQYNLGVMLGTGRGVPPNRDEAFRLFNKAAAQGHPQAIQALTDVQGRDT